MGKRITGLGAWLSLTLCVSCVSATEDDVARDFEFFVEDGKLEKVDLTLDEPGGELVLDIPVDRKRNGARFAWGGENSRGYFQLVREDLTYFRDGVRRNFEMGGIGGGAFGSPTIGDTNTDLVWMIPWRVDGTLYAGEDEQTEPDLLAYVEVHAEVGVGFQWKSLRPSMGIALSSIGGTLVVDDEDDDAEDPRFEGRNRGFYLDVKFMPEEYPVYGHFRAQAGDYEVTTFGIGFRF